MKYKVKIREIIDEGIDEYGNIYDGYRDGPYDYAAWSLDDENDSLCREIRYKYVDKNISPSYENDKWGGRRLRNPRHPRLSEIDMDSIYDKQTFRKKQIERVLGVEKETKPTLGDLYEYSKRT